MKIVIRVLVLAAVFVAALFGASRFLNTDTANTTQVMASATFPLVYIDYNGTQMNCLHGYAKEMDLLAMRDTLTPLGDDRIVHIQIQPFQNQIKSVSFEVLSADGSASVENTLVLSLEETEDYVTADLEIQNKLLVATEYIMKIQVTTDSREIYYYTRIVQQSDWYAQEYLDFVTGFYERCLSGSDEDGLISQTIEPSEEGDNTTLAHMDIHCSAEQLMWADLKPQVYLKPIPSLKELNASTATLEMDYVITAQGDTEEDVETYHVTEYYRVRYYDSRVMLLDFERDTNQIFDAEDAVFVKGGIRLGISSKDITYKNDPDQNFFAFVQEGALWLYEKGTHNLTQVFSFLQEGKLDARDIYDENDIQIIRVDEEGNLYFLVCGYMNRGTHEGECGVALYYFESAISGIRECLYVETEEAFALLDRDVSELAYISEDGTHFYLILEGTLYDIDIPEHTANVLLEDLADGCYQGSSSGRMFAWLAQNDRYDSTVLHLRDMETGARVTISCESDERIGIVGFMDDDLVYGVAKVSDIDTEYEGSEQFPMYQLLIVDETGAKVKEYAPSGYYVTGGEINERMLSLDRVVRTVSGFEEAEQDQIVNGTADESAAYGLTTQSSDRKQTELVLKTGETLSEKTTAQVIYALQLTDGTERTVSISAKEQSGTRYYVYAKGHLDSVFTAANQAVLRADEQLGVVVNAAQQIIWERGNKKTSCVLNLDEIPSVIRKGQTDVNRLEEKLGKEVLDLHGCELDSVLYFVSEGTPVLAQTENGVAVIVGYDEYNTILLNPGEDETYYCGLEDSRAMFEQAGNVFLTYFDPPEE